MKLITSKLAALEKIYTVYSDSIADIDVACAEKCAHCCTMNVTLTTLEAYRLWQDLDVTEKNKLASHLIQLKDTDRFRPAFTTNQLAEMCAAGQEPPTEKKAADQSRCLLLVEELCGQYDVRPFHCRCMVSQQTCNEAGSAKMDDFILAVNSVFLQVIEHMDRPGCTGNLLDLLPLMQSDDFRESYEDEKCGCGEKQLVENQPLKFLMIPPEFRHRMTSIITKLQSIQL